MKGITWSRDSHGLFDYESRHLTKIALKTCEPSSLTRVNNDIKMGMYGTGPQEVQPATIVTGPDGQPLI